MFLRVDPVALEDLWDRPSSEDAPFGDSWDLTGPPSLTVAVGSSSDQARYGAEV